MKSQQLFFLALFCSFSSIAFAQKEQKIQICILGTLHFKQFHDSENEPQNFFSDARQREFEEVTKKLSSFAPDAIYVEREPPFQTKLDSLYALPIKDTGLSEVFQIGFRLAKYLGQTKVIGVNYFESTSQSLLSAGENIGRYQDALAEFRNTGRGITKEFLQGGLSIADFLMELNRPDKVKMSHRLLYNTPAYVKDGSFNSYKDLGQIDNQYIGAEFISLFYKRNLKIYSNILNAQLSDESTKILLIVGQTHVGVLQGLFRENDSYEVVDVLSYLK